MIFANDESLNQLTQCMYNELFICTMLFRGHLTVNLGKTIINSCIVRQLWIEQGHTIVRLLVLHFFLLLL